MSSALNESRNDKGDRKRGESRLFPELSSEGMYLRIPVHNKATSKGPARDSERMLTAPSKTWEATVRAWIESCTQTSAEPGAFVSSQEAFLSFVKWIKGSGEAPGSMRRLTRFLQGVGFERMVKRVGGKYVRGFFGIKIRTVPRKRMTPLRKEPEPFMSWVREWGIDCGGEAPIEPEQGVTARDPIVYMYYPYQYILHVGFSYYTKKWVKITRVFGEDGVVIDGVYSKKLADEFYAQLLAAGFVERKVRGRYRERYEQVLSYRIAEGQRRAAMLEKELVQGREKVKRCFGIDVVGKE